MNDTPKHIKEAQLKIWLSKPPGERLKQFIVDNEVLFRFWKEGKKEIVQNKSSFVQNKNQF